MIERVFGTDERRQCFDAVAFRLDRVGTRRELDSLELQSNESWEERGVLT
jgi:hypothetical protein